MLPADICVELLLKPRFVEERIWYQDERLNADQNLWDRNFNKDRIHLLLLKSGIPQDKMQTLTHKRIQYRNKEKQDQSLFVGSKDSGPSSSIQVLWSIEFGLRARSLWKVCEAPDSGLRDKLNYPLGEMVTFGVVLS